MNSLSLRSKFTFLGLAVLFGVVGLAYTGYSAVDRLMRLGKLEIVTSAIRHHMELDMMHDAIHGDGQNAVTALLNHNKEDIDGAKKELKDHLATSEENFKAISELELSPEITEAYKTVIPEFEAYGKKASALLDIVAKDQAEGTQNYLPMNKDFQETFEKLEGIMSATSDKVQAWSKQIKDDGVNTAQSVRQQILIVLTISILLAMIAPLYARLSLFKMLGKLEDSAKSLAEEEYDNEVPHTERTDEIGNLARALELSRLKAGDAFRLKQMVEDMSLNIMTADLHNDFKINYANKSTRQTLKQLQQHLSVNVDDITGHSIDIFHKAPGRIRTLLSDPKNLPHQAKITLGTEVLDLKVSAMYDAKKRYVGPMLTWAVVTENAKLADSFEQSIGAASGQIASSATALQQSAVTLQGAIEELSQSALNISKRTHESLKIVKNAADKGEDARGFMQELSSTAGKVSGVVTLIRSIAEKTNLLALNATIESARAGEAGKGFAVVANEVKTLASQTANAITDISAQVADMQAAASGAFDIVKEMCDILSAVNKITADIASTVEEQQASTAEIARSVGDTKVARSKMETASVLAMVTQLQEVSNHLKTECAGFLEKVRKM